MTQKEALEILKMGQSAFLTGEAGSGKTHTLRAYIAYLKENGISVAVTASTGIAATHLDGTTIHSWSGLGVRSYLSEWDIDELQTKKYLYDHYEHTKVLIIDEVSMLHDYRFDLIDRLCRSFKRNNEPFGGMQVVMCGDFFQLPPINRRGETEGSFAFNSNAWRELSPIILYLEEQHRQEDKDFLTVLSHIRNGMVSQETHDILNKRKDQKIKGKIEPTKLYTHNEDVDVINAQELAKIKGKEEIFRMTSRGASGLVELLKKSCLAPEELKLKYGARVMFVKNNHEKKYVNGTLGIVEGFGPDGMPIIEISGGRRIKAEPEEWVVEENGKRKASIMQIPLRLAWAITVHKSQGMSLDSAEIDLSKSFERGMGYVALSRVRSLAGLNLLGLNEEALLVHPEIFEFDLELREKSEKAKRILKSLTKEKIKKAQDEFLLLHGQTAKKGGKKSEKIPNHKKTGQYLKQGLSIEEICKEMGNVQGTILDHIEKLIKEGEKPDLTKILGEIDEDKKDEILLAFRDHIAENEDKPFEVRFKLTPVKARLGDDFSFDEIRLVRLALLLEEGY